jgi:voltage-gated potassium channel Kch
VNIAPRIPAADRWASYDPTVAEDPIDDIEEVAEEIVATLREDLLGGDGFLVVLVLTIVAVIVIPIDNAFRGGSIVTMLTTGLLVLITLSRSKVSSRVRMVGLAMVAASVVIAVVAAIRDVHPATSGPPDHDQVLIAGGALAYCVLLAMCFPAILRRAFAHRKVTLNTVAASLAAYLVLGLTFMAIYRFVNIVNGPFFVQPDINGFTYEYFSYVTLTTVGYGDFVAATDAGRALAMFEALIGQVFLVTIVALVVSNLGQEHTSLRRSATGSAPSPDPRAGDRTGPPPSPARPTEAAPSD